MKSFQAKPMLETAKQDIDLVGIVESEGVELTQRGARWVGCCPFHSEQTPSFFVFPDRRFKCFGCGAHGDVIDFVQKLHGLTFPEALKRLGIEQGGPTAQVKADIQRRRYRTKLVKRFRDWEQWYCMEISNLWHKTKRLMDKGIPPGDLDLYAPLFHMLPVWEYHRDILINGTDKEKYELFKEAHKYGRV